MLQKYRCAKFIAVFKDDPPTSRHVGFWASRAFALKHVIGERKPPELGHRPHRVSPSCSVAFIPLRSNLCSGLPPAPVPSSSPVPAGRAGTRTSAGDGAPSSAVSRGRSPSPSSRWSFFFTVSTSSCAIFRNVSSPALLPRFRSRQARLFTSSSFSRDPPALLGGFRNPSPGR